MTLNTTNEKRLQAVESKVNYKIVNVDFIVTDSNSLTINGDAVSYSLATEKQTVAVLTNDDNLGVYQVNAVGNMVLLAEFNTKSKMNLREFRETSGRLFKVEVANDVATIIRIEADISGIANIVVTDNFEALEGLDVAVKDAKNLYATKDDKKLYLYEAGSVVGFEGLSVDYAGILATADVVVNNINELENALADTNNNVIALADGDFLTDALTIDRAVTLIAQNEGQAEIKYSGGNALTFIRFSANGVKMYGINIDFNSSDVNINHALVIQGVPSGAVKTVEEGDHTVYDSVGEEGYLEACGNYYNDLCTEATTKDASWQQTRIYGCEFFGKLTVGKGGISLFGGNTKIKAEIDFPYSSGTRRGVLLYGNAGENKIELTDVKNTANASIRLFDITSTTGNNPNETVFGDLFIKVDNTAQIRQFLNMDNHQKEVGEVFNITVDNSTVNGNNAFIVSYGVSNNFGDVFGKITVLNTTLTGTKGIFGADSFSDAAFRTTPLKCVFVNNTVTVTKPLSGWVESEGSVGGAVFNSTRITNVAVELIDGAGKFVEYSPQRDAVEPATPFSVKALFSNKAFIYADKVYNKNGDAVDKFTFTTEPDNYSDVALPLLYTQADVRLVNHESNASSVVLPDYNNPDLKVVYGSSINLTLIDLLKNSGVSVISFLEGYVVKVQNFGDTDLEVKAPSGTNIYSKVNGAVASRFIVPHSNATFILERANDGGFIYTVDI